MTPLILIFLFFLFGMMLGLICFLNLIPAIAILPKVSELEKKTRLGWPSLLRILFKWPAIWIIILGSSACSTVLATRDLRYCFLAGLLVALAYFFIELANMDLEKQPETLFLKV